MSATLDWDVLVVEMMSQENIHDIAVQEIGILDDKVVMSFHDAGIKTIGDLLTWPATKLLSLPDVDTLVIDNLCLGVERVLIEFQIAERRKGYEELLDPVVRELAPGDVQGYIDRGISYARRGYHERAIEDFGAAIRLDPKDSSAYLGRGASYMELDLHKRAFKDFDEAISLDPDNSLAYYNRGIAYRKLGRDEGPPQDVDDAVGLDENHEGDPRNPQAADQDSTVDDVESRVRDLQIAVNDLLAFGYVVEYQDGKVTFVQGETDKEKQVSASVDSTKVIESDTDSVSDDEHAAVPNALKDTDLRFFEDWLTSATELTEKIIRNYLGAIAKFDSYFRERKIVVQSLEEINDINQLNSLKADYFSDPVNQSTDLKGHQMYSAAFNRFISYKVAQIPEPTGNETVLEDVSPESEITADRQQALDLAHARALRRKERGDHSKTEKTSPQVTSSTLRESILGGSVPISAGALYSTALKQDGSLWAWGSNPYGELGDGTTTDRAIPKKILSITWAAVSSRLSHTVALMNTGSLWTWGLNGDGELGHGTTTDVLTPRMVGHAKWRSVSAGSRFTVALQEDSSLWTWGDNDNGQLGDGTTEDRPTPTRIGTEIWAAISAGSRHSLALRSDGSLWSWGMNDDAQLGDGTTDDRRIPVQIGDGTWQAISAGFQHSLGLQPDGSLWAWGSNDNGQLGDGTDQMQNIPVRIGTEKWQAISAGDDFSFGIQMNGSLWAWGVNGFGELGDGTNENRLAPVQIGSEKWQAVSAGHTHSLGLKADGSLWAWGTNEHGELARPSGEGSSHHIQVGSGSWWMDSSDVGTQVDTSEKASDDEMSDEEDRDVVVDLIQNVTNEELDADSVKASSVQNDDREAKDKSDISPTDHDQPMWDDLIVLVAEDSSLHDVHLRELGLKPRTMNGLRRAKIETLYDLLEHSLSSLRQLKNFGGLALSDLIERLSVRIQPE